MLKQLFSSCLLLYISVLYLRQRIFCAIYCYNIILKLNSEVISCNPYAKCNLGVSDVCSRFISLHIIFPYYAFGKNKKRNPGSNLFVFFIPITLRLSSFMLLIIILIIPFTISYWNVIWYILHFLTIPRKDETFDYVENYILASKYYIFDTKTKDVFYLQYRFLCPSSMMV